MPHERDGEFSWSEVSQRAVLRVCDAPCTPGCDARARSPRSRARCTVTAEADLERDGTCRRSGRWREVFAVAATERRTLVANPGRTGSAQRATPRSSAGTNRDRVSGVPDDPYTRLQALAAYGRSTRAAAAYAALRQSEPAPAFERRPEVAVIAWQDAKLRGTTCEDHRDFVAALAIYDRVDRDDANRIELGIARARCGLQLGIDSMAYVAACDVLAVVPDHRVALALRTRALSGGPALISADDWLARAPDPGAHYARGRALFDLQRFVEARAEFALVDTPAALLMRREVDRVMKQIRDTVGVESRLSHRGE